VGRRSISPFIAIYRLPKSHKEFNILKQKLVVDLIHEVVEEEEGGGETV
jgi:hypothetical protein